MDVPDGYEQKPLTDMQRFTGNLLHFENKEGGFFVSARKRPVEATSTIARQLAERMLATLRDGQLSSEEWINVNGMRAYRFEVEGLANAARWPKFNYVVTLVEGAEEMVIVNSWVKGELIEEKRESLQQLTYRIRGIDKAGDAAAPQPPLAASAAPGGETLTAMSQPVGTSTPSQPPASTTSIAAQIQTPPPRSPAEKGPPASAAEKLRELEQLRKEGLITQAEFEAKRRLVLDRL
jgi:hypothetical protein